MSIPALTAQIFAVRSGEVIVVQKWSRLIRGLCAIVFTVNDVVTRQQSGPAIKINRQFQAAGTELGPHAVDERNEAYHEGQMRDLLGNIVGYRERYCGAAGCAQILPIGGRWCLGCGTPYDPFALPSIRHCGR
jgi:hypothetical protein